MAAKLTKEIVNGRIADRGLRLVGEYETVNNKATFECSEGHQWSTTPDHVFRGSGCPHCAGNFPYTTESVNEALADRGLRVVSGFRGVRYKTTFECPEGHQWTTDPSSVLRGSGCPHCAGKFPHTPESINEAIVDRGLKVIGAVRSVKHKATFECSKGHQWETNPDNVLSGKGCPICANYGFDPQAPAELYTAEVLTDCGSIVFMIGITKRTFEKRYTQAERANMRLLRRQQFDTGREALAEERRLKEANRDLLVGDTMQTLLKFKGNTTTSSEIFSEDITKE